MQHDSPSPAQSNIFFRYQFPPTTLSDHRDDYQYENPCLYSHTCSDDCLLRLHYLSCCAHRNNLSHSCIGQTGPDSGTDPTSPSCGRRQLIQCLFGYHLLLPEGPEQQFVDVDLHLVAPFHSNYTHTMMYSFYVDFLFSFCCVEFCFPCTVNKWSLQT